MESVQFMSVSDSHEQVYHVLVVDDDSAIRDNLRQYLMHYHSAPYTLVVEEASTALEAMEKIKTHSFDLVICDVNLPDKDGFDVLKFSSEHDPKIKRALITAYDLDTYIPLAHQEKVYNILIKTAPFNLEELSTTVDNLLQPQDAFGLTKYLNLPKEDIHTVTLRSSHDIMIAYQKLQTFFEQHKLANLDALGIVIVEALTNAVYHSARNPDGSLRYKKGQEINALPPHEWVEVAYGCDNEKLGLSILDKGGCISADEVLYWLERNISGKSLMDTHGRGIYLIHRLMDRVVMNLHPTQRTELILLHYFEDFTRDNKPLYINQLPAQPEG